MLSEQFCMALLEMEALMHYIGNEEYAVFLRQEYEKLAQAINTYAWDGKWYMRALSQVENIGSKDSDGSKIYGRCWQRLYRRSVWQMWLLPWMAWKEILAFH